MSHPTKPDLLCREDIADILRRYADTFDTDALAAADIGVSVGILSSTIRGERRVGPVLLAFLGIERVDRYRVNRLTCRLEQAMQDKLIPRSRVYDDARRSAERSAADGEGGWIAEGAGDGGGADGAELQPEHGRQAAFAAAISARHGVRARRKVRKTYEPRSAAGDLGRVKRLSLDEVRGIVEAGEPIPALTLRKAYQTLRMISHPNSHAKPERRAEAVALFERIAGKSPVHNPTRVARDPRSLCPLAIKRAKAKLKRTLADTGFAVVTADTPAILAAADELVIDGHATAVSDREERVRSGPVAAGAATKRTRRVLKITGDMRI